MNRHPDSCLCPICRLTWELRGFPQELRGSAQPALPEVIQASGRYPAGRTDTTTDVGRLGRTTALNLGLFDLRPDLGKPARWDNRWFSRVKPVRGQGLTLRVEDRRPPGQYPLERQSLGLWDAWRTAVVSVVVSAGDSFPADFLAQHVASQDPFYAAADGWVAIRNARWGPNLIPSLSTRGLAELDLLRWAGHGRFLTAWLCAYWAVEDPANALDLVWTVWDSPTPSADWGPIAVSVPILSVVDGPWEVADDANALWRQGSYPLAARAEHRLGVINGGAAAVTIETRWHSSPLPGGAATWVTPVDLFGLAPARVEERTPPVGADGMAIMSVWASHTEEEGNPGGPLILTCTQGSTA